jgi:hypothetical protein
MSLVFNCSNVQASWCDCLDVSEIWIIGWLPPVYYEGVGKDRFDGPEQAVSLLHCRSIMECQCWWGIGFGEGQDSW